MNKTLTLTELAKHIGMPKRTLFDKIARKDFPIDPLPGITPRRWSVIAIDAWLAGGE